MAKEAVAGDAVVEGADAVNWGDKLNGLIEAASGKESQDQGVSSPEVPHQEALIAELFNRYAGRFEDRINDILGRVSPRHEEDSGDIPSELLEGLDDPSRDLVRIISKVVDHKVSPVVGEIRRGRNESFRSQAEAVVAEWSEKTRVPVSVGNRIVAALILENEGKPVSIASIHKALAEITPAQQTPVKKNLIEAFAQNPELVNTMRGAPPEAQAGFWDRVAERMNATASTATASGTKPSGSAAGGDQAVAKEGDASSSRVSDFRARVQARVGRRSR